MKQFVYYIECLHSLDNTRLLVTYKLMHTLLHIRTVIIPRNRYRLEGSSPRVDIDRGMITVLIWKRVCINLFITYFNIELKRTKLLHTHTHTKLWVIDIVWGMITVLIWKKAYIILFIKRLDIMLSEFCPDISPWVDIAVALRCLRMGKIDVITYKYVINYCSHLFNKARGCMIV
jgi:hypothetical protein